MENSCSALLPLGDFLLGRSVQIYNSEKVIKTYGETVVCEVGFDTEHCQL